MKNRKKNFTVLYPDCENVCLIKDVGMIPYILSKNYNLDAVIATYKQDEEYSYMREIPGVKLEFLQNAWYGDMLSGCFYLMKNARKIDFLQLYHVTSIRNFLWIILYKIMNPKGRVYLKMDLNYGLIEKFQYNKSGFKGFFKRKILSLCDVISVETMELAKKISQEWNRRIEYIPNGYFQKKQGYINYEQKENVICTVGRIGTYQKGTEILLEGFKKYAVNGNWKLRIIGEIDEFFLTYLKKFEAENKELCERITFVGKIEDRVELEEEYAKAKIFCMTSRMEGCAIVYMEAMRNGCYIVTTNVESVEEVLQKGMWGTVIPIDDVEGLAHILSNVTQEDEMLNENCREVQDYVIKNYDWNVIGEKIYECLIRKSGKNDEI